MSHKFNPGDIALVVACPMIPENIGREVELIQHLCEGELYTAPDGLIRSSEGDGWLVVGRVQGLVRGDGFLKKINGHAIFQECRLMPLRGDFAPLKQKSQAVPA